jgi:outer membrane protein OmpA-like peptidoglycan-associated protein
VSVLLLAAVAVWLPSPVFAQESLLGEDAEKPIKIGAEVFGGYSGYRIGGTIDGVQVPDFKSGWAGQFILNFGHWAGLVGDVSGHYAQSSSAYDLTFGPRLQLPLGHFRPFVEARTGGQHLSPKGFPSGNKPAYIFGGGVDIKVSSAFSIRPIDLSYIYTSYSVLPTSLRPKYSFNGFMAQAGLVYTLKRSPSEGEVLASCTAEPSVVDPGVQVKVGVTPKGFLPKRRLRYSYATSGGTISGSTATESIDTTGVGPGAYTITTKVVDDGRGKHQQTASCRAQFSVSAPPTPPPVVAVEQPTATPSPVPAKQPDDAPATAESVHTPLKINAPEPSRFGIIEFNRNAKRPTRVDNEAKAELDRYADALAARPDVGAVLVGRAGANGGSVSKHVLSVASRRAINTKDYMVKEKGIDSGRIEPRAGRGDGQITELWILPPAATFTALGTSVVMDEDKASTVPPVALTARNAHNKLRKKAHKKHKTVR